jgi:environmental stress-induced protein Ves
MKKISFKDCKTTSWSGGYTTELFIHPETSHFKEGNYNFRLSTATVEIDKSTFTALPDVKRTLMVLEGEMKLIHEGQYSKLLRPYDTDQFLGGWNTTSVGKCVDFNLMCKGDIEGQLTHKSMMQNSIQKIKLHGELNFLYIFKGFLEYQGDNYNEGDLLTFKEQCKPELTFWHQTDLVVIEINKLK